MSREYTYYEIKPGSPTDKIVSDFHQERFDKTKGILQIMEELGAVNVYGTDEMPNCFQFKPGASIPPCFKKQLVKDPTNYFRLNPRHPEGKTMIERMEKCRRPGIDELCKRLKAPRLVTMYNIGSGLAMGSTTYEILGETKVLKVPIESRMEGDETPPDDWQPGEDLRKLQMSEYWKFREVGDALEAKRKSEAAAAQEKKDGNH